jgi:2-methylcitrate dehydratase PrpD
MPTFVDRLTTFIQQLTWESAPAQIQDHSRDRLLDAISTAVAARNVGASRALLSAATALGGGPGECTALPSGGVLPMGQAALVNGTAVHAILFEDIHLTSSDHPGAVIVPAALAAVEASARLTGREATIEDLLLSVLAGYEVHLWLGRIAADGIKARKLRTTAIFGTVSAATAVSVALRLPAEQIKAALGYGANFAFGFLEGFAHGTMEPYIQAGVAAQNGIIAALIARGGALAASTPFEGPAGYFQGLADVAPGTDLADHGDWGIPGITAKPYPISGGKIGACDSALAAQEQGVDPAEIDHVVAYLKPGVQEFPGGNNPGPFSTMNEAQDSTQFVIAAALVGKPMGSLRTVMDEFADPVVADLARRTELISEPGRGMVAKVEVHLRDGSMIVGEEDRRAQQQPTVEKMSAKLEDLTAGYWAPGRAQAVIDLVTGVGETPARELSRLLRG